MPVFLTQNAHFRFLLIWTRTQTGHGYRRSRAKKHVPSAVDQDMHDRRRIQTWALTQTGMGADADGHFVETKCTFVLVKHTWTQTQTDVAVGADGHLFGSGNTHGLRSSGT